MIVKLIRLVFFGLLSKAISLVAPLVLMRFLAPEIYGSIVLLRSTINETSASLSGSSRIILKKTFFSFKDSKIYSVVNYHFFLMLILLLVLTGAFGSMVIINNLKHELGVLIASLLVFLGVIYYVLKSIVITKYFSLFQSKKVNRFILISSFAEAIALVSCLFINAYWIPFLLFFITGILVQLVSPINPLSFYLIRPKLKLTKLYVNAVKKFHARVTFRSVVNSVIMPLSVVAINSYIFAKFGAHSLAKISIYIAINGVILAGLSQANDFLQSKILIGSDFRTILLIQSFGALIITLLGFSISPLVFIIIGDNYELDVRFIPFFIMFNTLSSIKYALSSMILKYGKQSISLISNGFWVLTVLGLLSYFTSEIVRIAAPLFGHITSLIIVSLIMLRKKMMNLHDYIILNVFSIIIICCFYLCIELL